MSNSLGEVIKNKDFININDLNPSESNDNLLIKDIQLKLVIAGYLSDHSQIDGIVGRLTLNAFNRFKKDNDLEHPDILGATTAKELLDVKSVNSKFFLPTDSIGWISSPYGMRTLNGRTRMHGGIDIAANTGVNVYAVADGVVTNITNHCKEGDFRCGSGFGNWIEISHPQLKIITRYCHLLLVNKNDGVTLSSKVKQGQKIGEVGNTGHSFGSHLHFEILENGARINPTKFGRWV